jgi:DNA modification methylase
LFTRDNFLNEIIWVYDYGTKAKNCWASRHDTILVFVKNKDLYYFNQDDIDREPYMAPVLVTKEKAKKGKLPTDVWWHTIIAQGTDSCIAPGIAKGSAQGIDSCIAPGIVYDENSTNCHSSREARNMKAREALFRRIVSASTKKNDTILKLFMHNR